MFMCKGGERVRDKVSQGKIYVRERERERETAIE